MSGYNCTIELIEGTTNTCADLLSRHPDNVSVERSLDTGAVESDKDDVVLDVNDYLYEVNVLNSSQFEPKPYASYDLPEKDTLEKSNFSDFTKIGLDMKLELSRDDEISEVRSMIRGDKERKEIQKHYLLIDNLV